MSPYLREERGSNPEDGKLKKERGITIIEKGHKQILWRKYESAKEQ